MVDLALRTQFQRARTLWLSLALTRDLAWSVAFLLASALLAFHLDRHFVLSPHTRLVWGLVTLVLTTLIGLGRGWWSVRRQPDDRTVALHVERRHPHLRERLLSAVELGRLPEVERQRYSAGLLAAVQAEAEQAARGLDFRRAVTWSEAAPAVVTCVLLAAVAALHVAFAPAAVAAWWGRMLQPGADIPVYRNTRVRISPRETVILRGTDLGVLVDTEGRPVDRAWLHFRTAGSRWTRIALRPPFRHRLQGLAETTEFYATAGDGQSDRGRARVVDRPAVVGLRLNYRFPDYMARPDQVVSGVSGTLSVPVGTRVELAVTASKPLESAAIAAGPRPASLSVTGESASGTAQIWSDTILLVRLRDTDGFEGRSPHGIPFHAVVDQTPEVRLEQPVSDLDVVADASVPLRAVAADDYGLNRLWLAHGTEKAGVHAIRRSSSAGLPPGDLQPEGRSYDARTPERLALAQGARLRRALDVSARWNLSGLGLRPGDVVVYRAEADDFDDLRGPHIGRSGEQRLRIVDRAEMARRLAEGWDQWDQQLVQVIQEQAAARAAVRQARTPAALAAAERRQRDLAPRADELARRAAELAEMTRTNRLAAEASIARQERAGAELADIARRAMPEAADRIRESVTQPARRTEATARQAEIGRRLQELRRQAQPESDLEALARRAEELARAQAELQGQSQRLLTETLGLTLNELLPRPRAELDRMSRSQRSLRQATGQFERSLAAAARVVQQRAPAASRFMRERAIPERQDRAAQQVAANALGRAASGQQTVAADLRRIAALLRQTPQTADAARQQALARARQQLERMMEQHAELMRRAAAQPNAAQSRQLARQERALREQAARMREQLRRAQVPSQSLQDAAQRMEQAARQLDQGAPQRARSPQQQAQEAMRRMAQQLQDAQSNRMADAERERLRRELNELAQRQGAISKALQRPQEDQGRTPEATDGRPEGAPAEAPDGPPRAGDPQIASRLAPRQEAVSRTARQLSPQLPSETFRSAMTQAEEAMRRAGEALRRGESGPPTRSDSQRAERLLQQMARALEQQSPNASPGGQQNGANNGQQQPQQNAAELARQLADLRLLRSMEQALREETGETNGEGEGQQERLRDLAQRQAQARRMTARAGEGLRQFPGVGRRVGEAAGAMGQAQRGLQEGSAGAETQGAQATAVMRLTQAIGQGQQQLQAMARPGAGQPGGQNNPEPGRQGTQPALDSVAVRGSDEGGPRALVPGGKRGFGLLSPGDQQALRQGSREKVPTDYADLVRRYYRALSERAR